MNSETERQGMRPNWEFSRDPCSVCKTRVNVAVYNYSSIIQTAQGECLASSAISLCPKCARAKAVKEKQGGLKGNAWLIK